MRPQTPFRHALPALLAIAFPGAAAATTYQCAYVGGAEDNPAAQMYLTPGDVTFDPATLHFADRSRWRIDGPFAQLLRGQDAQISWSGPELEIRAPYVPGKVELVFHFNTRTHAGSFEEALVATDPAVRAFFDADCKRVNQV